MGKLRVLSDSDAAFEDRIEAGRLLAGELEDLRGRGIVVLGIPRGGVVVGRELALALDGDLDIVLARKVGAPGNPELAIGALAEDGKLFLDDRLAEAVGADRAYIESERALVLAEIARRSKLYRSVRPKVPLKDRIVVVTDDGVATGATLQASLWAARQEAPRKLIAAIPVGPADTVRRLAEEADEFVCLRTPAFFRAVGRFYVRFDQTEDEELLEILQREAERAGAK